MQLFSHLPPGIRAELLEERDPHGNVQVGVGWVGVGRCLLSAHWHKGVHCGCRLATSSEIRHWRLLCLLMPCCLRPPPLASPRQVSHIQTEKLLVGLVGQELLRRKAQGTYRGKFAALSHFFG